MVWTIILANIITVGVSFLFLNRLAQLTVIRGTVLIPFLTLLIFTGSYTNNNALGDLVVTLFFGLLGYFMLRFHWPRAPLVLGLVLGKVAERYLWISTARYGLDWLGRPIVLVLIALTVLVVALPFIQEWRARDRMRRETAHAT